jgi:hypothetical protein
VSAIDDLKDWLSNLDPVSVDSLWNSWRNARLPAPRTLRDTFDLLGHYDPAQGIDALVARIDFAAVPPGYIHQVVHDRQPESVEALVAAERHELAERFKHALLSDEFQLAIIRRFLTAYPEKRRLVFLHVPKCAGTNLEIHLIPRHLALSGAIEGVHWTGKPKMLEWLAGWVKAAPLFDTVFVHGHIFFDDFIRRVGTRWHDHIFTVVRDPLELAVSQANYSVGRLLIDPRATRPDTREAMAALELETIPNPFPLEFARELAIRALMNPRIAQPNRICTYLGDGTAEKTVANLAIHNVEVTDMARYPAWIAERWGVTEPTRYNRSPPLLRAGDAEPFRDELMSRCAEDYVVYGKVKALLDARGQASVRGADLA